MNRSRSRGTTLVEAMVAIAMTLVVGGAITSMVLLGSRGSNGVANSIAFDDMINQIRFMMRGDAACGNTVNTVNMIPLSGAQKFGDPATGANVPTIYNVDGTTPFINLNGNYQDLTKIQLQLYDLGAMDNIAAMAPIHIAALYIGATRNMGTTAATPHIGTTIYIPVMVSGGAASSCPYAIHNGNPQLQNVAATGSNISGMWFVFRAGDANGNMPARPGTIDFAFGTGPVVGAGPIINPPGSTYFDPGFVSTPSNTVSNITDKSWSRTIYKQW